MTAAATTGQAYLLRPEEGQAIWFLNNRMTLKATAQSTGGAYGLLESLIAPGFSPPLHVHRREDEALGARRPRHHALRRPHVPGRPGLLHIPAARRAAYVRCRRR